jgi:hypothetical protein
MLQFALGMPRGQRGGGAGVGELAPLPTMPFIEGGSSSSGGGGMAAAGVASRDLGSTGAAGGNLTPRTDLRDLDRQSLVLSQMRYLAPKTAPGGLRADSRLFNGTATRPGTSGSPTSLARTLGATGGGSPSNSPPAGTRSLNLSSGLAELGEFGAAPADESGSFEAAPADDGAAVAEAAAAGGSADESKADEQRPAALATGAGSAVAASGAGAAADILGVDPALLHMQAAAEFDPASPSAAAQVRFDAFLRRLRC